MQNIVKVLAAVLRSRHFFGRLRLQAAPAPDTKSPLKGNLLQSNEVVPPFPRAHKHGLIASRERGGSRSRPNVARKAEEGRGQN